jgi:CRISPR-associated protein Cas5 subtype I-B
MQALRLELYQPSANYRVPYAYQRRLTYPLPPYATVLGFLRNLIGNLVGDPLPIADISIGGRFQTKLTEYTWLRSLKASKHREVFGPPIKKPIQKAESFSMTLFPEDALEENSSLLKRKKSKSRRTAQPSSASAVEILSRERIWGLPEHPGGQIPVRVDVLHGVELIIHLTPKEERLIDQLLAAIQNPTPHETPHLGRAEDFVVLRSVKKVLLEEESIPPGRYPYAWWVPYDQAEGLEGLYYRIALKAQDTSAGRAVEPTLVLLWEGEAPYAFSAWWDEDKKLPVFLHKL